MLGLSWTELLVIGVVALIVIGPKDLPIMMRRIGEFVGQVRRMGSEFQRELNRAVPLDEVRDIKRSFTEPLRQAEEEITGQFNKMTPVGMQPSGILAPRDPKAESVVDEIRAQAGMAPLPKPAQPAVAATAPIETIAPSPNPDTSAPARKTPARRKASPAKATTQTTDAATGKAKPKKPARLRAAKQATAAPTVDDTVTSAELPPVATAAKPPRAPRKRAATKPSEAPEAAAEASAAPARRPRSRKTV